jgi:uncharacterized membrane protein (UPF0127 family)
MCIINEAGRILASEVDIADTFFSQGMGLMFRRSISDEYALVLRFERQRRRDVHMLFVFMSIDVCWLCDGIVQETKTLRPWIGHASTVADTVIEFPAGTLDGITAGDRIEIYHTNETTENSIN